MKTDTYTKIILTVIAVNLSVITFKPLISPSVANAAVSDKQPISAQPYGLVPVNKDGSINVKLNSDEPLSVKLVSIDHLLYLDWDAINVKTSN
jgi:hypothetical protein